MKLTYESRAHLLDKALVVESVVPAKVSGFLAGSLSSRYAD